MKKLKRRERRSENPRYSSGGAVEPGTEQQGAAHELYPGEAPLHPENLEAIDAPGSQSRGHAHRSGAAGASGFWVHQDRHGKLGHDQEAADQPLRVGQTEHAEATKHVEPWPGPVPLGAHVLEQ